MDHCPLLFFGANEIGSDHVYGKKLMTKTDHQGHTCTTMVGEEQTMCILSWPTSSTANSKTSTNSADNFWLTYVINYTRVILPPFLDSSTRDGLFFDDSGQNVPRGNGCSPLHNTASGSATGLEVFLNKIPDWDSLGEGQIDPNGARVNTFLLSLQF
jgi:hypothetical protein